MPELERYTEEPQRKIAKGKKPFDVTLLFMGIGAVMIFVSVIISLTFSFEFFTLTAFSLIFYLIGSFSNKRKNNMITIVFSILFLLFGLGVAFWGSPIVMNGWSSNSWPVVQGKIIVSETDEKVHTGGNSGNRTVSIYIKPKVEYEYNVEDNQYTYNNISFGEYGYRGSRHARKILGRYKVGRLVEVYYNPSNPGQSVLRPGLSWPITLPAIVGLLFALVAGGILFKCITGKMRKTPEEIDKFGK